jgi:hypothetical protein
MRNYRRTLTVLLIIASPIGGFLGGQWAGQTLMAGASVPWQLFGSPPEPAVRILGLREAYADNDVYIETVTGATYYCCSSHEIRWQLTKELPSWYSAPCGTRTPFFTKPSPPGEIIDCAEIVPFEEWNYRETQFVLLEDNSVWKWHKSVDFIPAVLSRAGGFSCGGLVLGLAISVFVWRKRL